MGLQFPAGMPLRTAQDGPGQCPRLGPRTPQAQPGSKQMHSSQLVATFEEEEVIHGCVQAGTPQQTVGMRKLSSGWKHLSAAQPQQVARPATVAGDADASARNAIYIISLIITTVMHPPVPHTHCNLATSLMGLSNTMVVRLPQAASFNRWAAPQPLPGHEVCCCRCQLIT
jgi:hypothetical protein